MRFVSGKRKEGGGGKRFILSTVFGASDRKKGAVQKASSIREVEL